MTSKHAQSHSLIAHGIFDSLTSFKEFENRVSALFELNTKAQGDAFEIFVEAYLATQSILQCQETWLVGSIPIEIRETLNLPNDSKGIDGIYRTMLDEYVPYQVKFRTNRPSLGFAEVAPFLGITEKATDRLLITNCDSIAIDVQNRTGMRSLRGSDFDLLDKSDFFAIEQWLKEKPATRRKIIPHPFQVEALANIAAHLDYNDRGTVVMACGTGKTLIELWAAEQSKAKSILILVPSLALLQQTLEEWSLHNSWGSNFSYLCVCSDPQVGLKNDEIEINSNDIPFRIDTNPEIVKQFLSSDNGKTKIVFTTYQSSHVICEGAKYGFDFDLAIFDEAHKTTGSSNGRFALALHNENLKIKKRLFFTATPKHYEIKKRDSEGELKFVSMDDVSLYGKRAHTFSFSSAVNQGMICPYKVIVTLIDKKQVDDFALANGITFLESDAINTKWVANQIAVDAAIKHANAKKVITFHSRVKNAQDFASKQAYGIKAFSNDIDVFHVNGAQRSHERKDTLLKFRNSPKSLITNAKCLTEGINIPAVDMVVFVDPRHSKIDIAQAVGRAMRKPCDSNKEFGYIVVPIYATDTSAKSLQEAINNENFDDVILVLNALLEQDDEFVEVIRELKQNKGEGGSFNPKKLKGIIEVIGPVIDLDQLTQSIYLKAVDRLGSNWDEWYGMLIHYKKTYGDCLVPQRYVINDANLGDWVRNQRTTKDKLSSIQLKKLDSIGFAWNKFDHQWEAAYRALKDFRRREGHCKVVGTHTEGDVALGAWVKKQRHRKSELSEDRLKRLETLDFIWEPYDNQWETGFSALVNFKNREGHCIVPLNHNEDGIKLGNWVSTQRLNKKSPLTEDRKKRLNDIGFSWDPFGDQWEQGFSSLRSLKEREGNLRVGRKFTENGFPLGVWIDKQRQSKSQLSAERLSRLNFIGFPWDPHAEVWEKSFDALVQFKNREGHLLVPTAHIEKDIKLGTWVDTQRQNISELSKERLQRLNEVGFIWNAVNERWEQAFKLLQVFKEREGHCKVPKDHIEGLHKLGSWVSNQRTKKLELSSERKTRLNELGFVWSVLSPNKKTPQ